MDLEDESSIRAALESRDFDLLINPAALTNVDLAEKEPALASSVNTRAPEVMAEICRERGARLIHISTDYVFDGVQTGARTEEDTPNPLNT